MTLRTSLLTFLLLTISLTSGFTRLARMSVSMGIKAFTAPDQLLALRQGVVLVSQTGEHNHYLYQQTAFVYEHSQRGSKAVILERPTAFSMGEISPGIGVFKGNTLYMGGDQGGDTAIMLHAYNISGFSKYCGEGIYVGGIKEARELVADGKARPKEFKFFFNGVEWPPGVLEMELKAGRWDVVEATPDLVLKQGSATTLWRKARSEIRKARGETPTDDEIDDEG